VPIRSFKERDATAGRRGNLRLASAREEKRREEPNDSQVQVMSREEFVAMFAEDYTPSHLTMIGPTQRGKTTLCFDLLRAVLAAHKDEHWKVVFLHGKIKKRDHVMKDMAKQDNYRIVRSWPPGMTFRPKHWRRNVNGYILRPLGNDKLTAAEEEKLLKAEFGRSINTVYHSTRNVTITVIDERAQADKDLKLGKDLDAPLQRGLPHNPEWNNIQRGAWCSYHCYDAPEHIFLFVDDDDSNIDRYAEFGVGDPRIIKKVMARLTLKKVETGGTISQCLYMRRSDRFMCIVDT
jgi:hypothetical protein